MGSERATNVIPCLMIEAADWIDTNDVRHWVNTCSVATWGSPNGDIFTLYDHGDGPDKDEMPDWLWEFIEAYVREAGLEYCIVRLEDC